MKRIEDHCCGCAVPGYPCLGPICPRRHVEVTYCDRCDPYHEHPLDEVYEEDGLDLCESCRDELYNDTEE